MEVGCMITDAKNRPTRSAGKISRRIHGSMLNEVYLLSNDI
jgi:hypothetical protein